MSFHGIFGHHRQIDIIERAVESGKVPHAYLFTGIGGVGKRLVALKLAQAMQCDVPEERPCGNCTSCRKVSEDNHPDITVVIPDGNFIKIEQVRGLQKRLGYKPFEGKATVCIIDGADKMNISAANCLLKTLEEPPPQTHLIVLAENIRQVIPTIISRCQRLRFNPLSVSHVEEILKMQNPASEGDMRIAAAMSDGSPGKAIAFMGTFPAGEKEELLGAIKGHGSVEKAFSLAEKMTAKERGNRLMESLELIKFYFRDMVYAKTGMSKDSLVNMNHRDLIEKEAGSYSMKELLKKMDVISETETAILMNANKRLAVENMLLKIFKRDDLPCLI